MKMKPTHWLIALWAVAGLVLLACGGGGGGGGSTGGSGGGSGGGAGDVFSLGTTAPLQGTYIEVIDGRAGAIDPFSLRPGSEVQLVTVSYSSTGARTVQANTGFTVGGASASQVRLESGGRLVALATTAAPFSVSTRVLGVEHIMQMMISNYRTVIAGKVFQEGRTTGVKFVQVEAVNAARQVVASAMTGDGGTFRMRVPTSVKGISVRAATIDNTVFYRQIRYKGKDYAADAGGCPIPLPATIPADTTTTLTDPIYVLRQGAGPPPPPPSCF